jgi:hypothetical protein
VLTAKKLKKPDPETGAGIPLAPRPEDLHPWYSRKQDQAGSEVDERLLEILLPIHSLTLFRSKQDLNQKKRDDPLFRSKQDLNRKKRDDPLTSISRELALQASAHAPRGRPPPRPKHSTSSDQLSDVDSRLRRESSERQRAQELIRRRQREARGLDSPSMTPNRRDEYDDLFNPQEIMQVKEVRRLHFQRKGHSRRDAS